MQTDPPDKLLMKAPVNDDDDNDDTRVRLFNDGKDGESEILSLPVNVRLLGRIDKSLSETVFQEIVRFGQRNHK